MTSCCRGQRGVHDGRLPLLMVTMTKMMMMAAAMMQEKKNPSLADARSQPSNSPPLTCWLHRENKPLTAGNDGGRMLQSPCLFSKRIAWSKHRYHHVGLTPNSWLLSEAPFALKKEANEDVASRWNQRRPWDDIHNMWHPPAPTGGVVWGGFFLSAEGIESGWASTVFPQSCTFGFRGISV